jgi:hypothetical protein
MNTRRIPTNEYYRIQWRSACFGAILQTSLCIAAIATCVCAVMYGFPKTAIWCGIMAAYCAFNAWLRFASAEEYHTLYLRSLIEEDEE